MQNVNRMLVALSIMSAVLVISAPSHAAEDNVVKWDAMIGLAAPGSKVGNFDPFGPVFPIVVQDGKAWVHLQTGRAKFSVKGLALANSTGLAAAGTTGVISEVRGTLVCNGVVPAGRERAIRWIHRYPDCMLRHTGQTGIPYSSRNGEQPCGIRTGRPLDRCRGCANTVISDNATTLHNADGGCLRAATRIGGAGTFDCIELLSIVAAYVA